MRKTTIYLIASGIILLMLKFQQGVLVDARIRTPDSASYHPPDAPPDLVSNRTD